MNKTIWKYELDIVDKQFIELPNGSEILSVQMQGSMPCLWAAVNPTISAKEERCIEIFGTGHDIHCDMGIDRIYINTFQMLNGQLIYHVFERTH